MSKGAGNPGIQAACANSSPGLPRFGTSLCAFRKLLLDLYEGQMLLSFLVKKDNLVAGDVSQ